MNAKETRLVFALMLAMSVFGISSSTVLADPPIMYEVGPMTDSTIFPDLCTFPISVNLTMTIQGTDFVDNSGVVIRSHWHIVEQDIVTANGKTLVGLPYTFNAEVYWDSNGNPTRWYMSGILEKIQLPYKGIFNPAGRTNVIENQYGYTLTPDRGNPGNIAGFCAALSE